jgi:iron complex outermembrane receptor protein
VADPLTYVNGTARNGWARKLQTAFGYTPSYDITHSANLNGQQRLVSRTDGLSNELDWRAGDFTLTSVTAWRRLYFRPSNDSDGTPYSIFSAGYDVDVNQYSQEFRLASPQGGPFEYQLGAYFLRQKVQSNYRTLLFSNATAFFVSPLLPAAILNGVEADQLGRSRTLSGAVFGQGTWRLSDRASITAGLRYSRERKEASNTVSNFGGVALTGPLAPYAAYRTAVVGAAYSVADEKTKGSVSWLINPSYRFSDGVLGYASISHGEKSGAANLGAKAADRVIIEPETSTDYELGVKSTLLGGRAILNADLYWTDITGYQATLVDTSGTTARSYLANVGKVRLRGVEVEGQLQASDHLNLSASAAYGESIYVSYPNAPPPAEYTYAGAPASVDLSGTQVPFAPRFTGQAGFSYHRPLGGNLALFAYGTQTWRSATYQHALSVYGRQQAYGLTNLGLGVRTADDRYALQVWGKNIFDKRYAAAFGAATAVTPYVEIIGDPRTYGLTFTVKTF